MEKEDFMDLILTKLDKVINLLEIKERREIENLKNRVLGKSKIKIDIYDLMDGKKTVNEISNLLKILPPNVSRAIKEMVDGGLVSKKSIGKSILYNKKFGD